MPNRRVLLVEDEPDILAQFAAKIRKKGYEVLTAQNGVEALKVFRGAAILVVVTDIRMPLKDGLQVLEAIKKHSPTTRVIVITGLGGKLEAIKALKLDAFDYIEKGPGTAASELMDAIERAFKDVQTQVTAEKQMLAFLTHTLSSTISGGPITVDQILEDAQSALGDKYHDDDIHRIINNIASLKAIFLAMANMLRAYKIFVNEPAAFEQKWRRDAGGNLSLDYLLSAVLKQTLGSLLFEETNVDQLERILAEVGGPPIRRVRETFLKEVFWSETATHDTQQVLRWCEQYFPIISMAVDDPLTAFNLIGVRYPFLFSIFSEIIYNAFKYTDCRGPIRIDWRKRGDAFTFSCENTFSKKSRQSVGAQKGLAFVNGLSQMIEGIEFLRRDEGGDFTVELQLQGALLS
jgi:DNA-binding response OmpR family regulator